MKKITNNRFKKKYSFMLSLIIIVAVLIAVVLSFLSLFIINNSFNRFANKNFPSLSSSLSTIFFRTPVDCEGLSGAPLTRCVVKNAVHDKNPDFCRRFTNDYENALCFQSVALATNDSAVCDAIFDPLSADYCRKDVFVQTNRSDLCNSLSGTPHDGCYNTLGLRNLDKDSCLSINDSSLRDKCLDKIGHKLSDPFICSLISDDISLRDSCLFRTSIDEASIKGCSLIIDPSLRETCATNVAGVTGDRNICRSLRIDDMVTLCNYLVDRFENKTLSKEKKENT